MTLTDFILARIAEDEAAVCAWDSDGAAQVASMWTGLEPGYATVASGRPASGWFADGREVEDARHVEVLYNPARVLAECEAKRAIVQGWGQFLAGAPEWAEREMPSVLRMARMTLHALALPYADHPDYRQEWKP